MTVDTIFLVANTTAFVAWVVLILFQRARWATTVVPVTAVTLFATLYVAVLGANWMGSEGGFSTLSGVATLFSSRWLLLAGWVHYLAFDLLVGRWEVLDAQRLAISRWLMAPILVITFMFGPAGWLLYVAVRLGFRRSPPPAALLAT
jgi:hypothetical protein